MRDKVVLLGSINPSDYRLVLSEFSHRAIKLKFETIPISEFINDISAKSIRASGHIRVRDDSSELSKFDECIDSANIVQYWLENWFKNKYRYLYKRSMLIIFKLSDYQLVSREAGTYYEKEPSHEVPMVDLDVRYSLSRFCAELG